MCEVLRRPGNPDTVPVKGIAQSRHYLRHPDRAEFARIIFFKRQPFEQMGRYKVFKLCTGTALYILIVKKINIGRLDDGTG